MFLNPLIMIAVPVELVSQYLWYLVQGQDSLAGEHDHLHKLDDAVQNLREHAVVGGSRPAVFMHFRCLQNIFIDRVKYFNVGMDVEPCLVRRGRC